jgi:hypothetical protein
VNEELPPPSREGSVVLDVGGSVGAAIVHTGAPMAGEEIEIRRFGNEWDGTHTAIRQRHLGEVVAFAGVFGSLEAGRYQLRIKPGTHAGPSGHDRDTGEPVLDLVVAGGAVTQVDWPVP